MLVGDIGWMGGADNCYYFCLMIIRNTPQVFHTPNRAFHTTDVKIFFCLETFLYLHSIITKTEEYEYIGVHETVQRRRELQSIL
jgi:hypothetical protein